MLKSTAAAIRHHRPPNDVVPCRKGHLHRCHNRVSRHRTDVVSVLVSDSASGSVSALLSRECTCGLCGVAREVSFPRSQACNHNGKGMHRREIAAWPSSAQYQQASRRHPRSCHTRAHHCDTGAGEVWAPSLAPSSGSPSAPLLAVSARASELSLARAMEPQWARQSGPPSQPVWVLRLAAASAHVLAPALARSSGSVSGMLLAQASARA